MAIFVPPVHMARHLGADSLDIEATTVGELLEQVRERVGEQLWSPTLRPTVLVNGVAISRLQGLKTVLRSSDEVWLALPAGGG